MLVPFFRAAKVLPVERGAGMFQQGLAAAEARLAAGDWVHIFPEGTRSRDGKMGPVRKGVGRLVASCADARPVIVPFVHSGMEEVLPKGSLLPKANKEVRAWWVVVVGETGCVCLVEQNVSVWWNRVCLQQQAEQLASCQTELRELTIAVQ